MARKFGKENDVKIDILNYNIGLLGESKIGKTTIIKEVCEKLVGKDGYMFLEMFREDGADAIQGIVYENVPTWEYFDDIVTDIVENKTTDYKDLRVVVIDTYDQLIALAEQETIRLHNRENPEKRVSTINSACGGFGKGVDTAIDLMFSKLWELKSVGVSYIIIGHVKTKDINDVATGETYQTLTSDTTQKYFNAIKTKLHFLGLAYIDRQIVKEKTGKKNIVNNKEITKNVVKSETRKIKFRDDNYAVDSGSRFAEIVDEVPFTADNFIQALTDAIKCEQAKSGKTFEQTKKEQAKDKADKEKELAQAEVENKLKKELDTYIDKVNEFIQENKTTNVDAIRSVITKCRELGFSLPSEITDVKIAKELADFVLYSK